MSGPYGPATGGAPGVPPGGQASYPPAGVPPYQQPAGPPSGPHYQPGPAPSPAGWGQGGGWAPAPPYGPPGQQLAAPAAPAVPRRPTDLTTFAPLLIVALGILNFIWGFLPSYSVEGGIPEGAPRSVFAMGPGYLPVLLFAAGLLALGTLVPKPVRVQFPVAAVSVASAIAVIVTGFVTGGLMSFAAVAGGGSGPAIGKGIGLILLLIFGVIQAIVAVAWWLMDARAGGSAAPAGGPGGAAAPNAAGYGDRPPAPRYWEQQRPVAGFPATPYGQPGPAPHEPPAAPYSPYGQPPASHGPAVGYGAEPPHPPAPAAAMPGDSAPGAPGTDGPGAHAGAAEAGPDDNPEETRQLRF